MEPSETVTAAGRTLPVYGGKGADAPLFLLIAEDEEAASVWQAARALTSAPFRLAAFPAENWNDALSPWPAEAVFRGGGGFGGKAEETLDLLVRDVLPALRAGLGAPEAPCYLAGYSLAGLFAVYALYRSAAFAGAVSASGSLWFPGFREFALSRPLAGTPEKVCFSLGEREKNTKNPLMRQVQDCTEAVFGHFQALGIPCVFRPDPGGHFRDAEKRLALGIAWMLGG